MFLREKNHSKVRCQPIVIFIPLYSRLFAEFWNIIFPTARGVGLIYIEAFFALDRNTASVVVRILFHCRKKYIYL